ncbi:patatin-like phospholipase family protein [Candidatus Pacearchaeota archaeon]|nr:patatin-like phospholipase family protein [Candidatus Pacearchaeota archaeon]
MGFTKKRGLALALSGGSVRGLAHIGFLEVLEENNIKIDYIVGTSMGALVGGIYAAGKLKEFKKKMLKLSKNKILSLLLSNQFKRGNTDTKEIEKFIKKFVENRKIENLQVGFTAIATDLKTGKEVYLEEGDLLKSISASISIPGIFQPVKMRGMLLVDGGVVDPLPEGYASEKARKVIAVNALPMRVNYRRGGGTFEILSEVAGIMLNEIIGRRKGKEKNKLFVQIKTRNIDSFDFKSASRVIGLGRTAAKKHLKRIIELANS